MKARWIAAGAVLGVVLTMAVVRAQTRQDLQMQQDLRMLQEQIQQLKAVVATLATEAKGTNARLDDEASAIRKNHADELDMVSPLRTKVDGLDVKLGQYSVEVRKFAADLPSLRAGLDQQQKSLDRLVNILSSPVPTPAAFTSTGAPPAPGTQLPLAPSAIFSQARRLYAQTQYQLAAQQFKAVTELPDAESSAYADEAQLWIGMSQFADQKYPAAQAAFQKLIDTYKTSSQVPEAYFQLGECYRVLGKKAEANAAYMQAYNLAPDSDPGLRAKQQLGIK